MDSGQILIVGATGKQGSAVIAALHSMTENGDPPPTILALTRSSQGAKALQLMEKYPNIRLVEGDSRQPGAIFAACPKIESVFLVTVPQDEEAQALPLIDAAVQQRVRHIVFSSVDRGGNDISWTTATNVPHFASKHNIELYLRSVTANTPTKWTVLRPTGFMDNYSPGFFGKLMGTIWATMPADRQMQLVSTHDIGRYGAIALLEPKEWESRAVALAGDSVTFRQAEEIFRRTTQQSLPKSWTFVGWAVRWSFPEAGRSMDWFENVGYGADIESLRSTDKDLQTFEQWLRDTSGWTIKNP